MATNPLPAAADVDAAPPPPPPRRGRRPTRPVPSWATGLTDSFPIPFEHLPASERAALDPPSDDDNDSSPSSAPPLPTSAPNLLALPPELRNRIYSLILFTRPAYTRRRGRNRTHLSLLRICRRVHDEAAYVLYSTRCFRLFALQEFAAAPTVAELPPHYRRLVANVEVVLGSSWTKPPRDWVVTEEMGRVLGQMEKVRTLRVFVELDPSHPVFARYRVSEGFYTEFCGGLLRDVLGVMPRLRDVEVDGNPSVMKTGPLVRRLVEEVRAAGKGVKWGRERGWGNERDDEHEDPDGKYRRADEVVFVGGHAGRKQKMLLGEGIGEQRVVAVR